MDQLFNDQLQEMLNCRIVCVASVLLVSLNLWLLSFIVYIFSEYSSLSLAIQEWLFQHSSSFIHNSFLLSSSYYAQHLFSVFPRNKDPLSIRKFSPVIHFPFVSDSLLLLSANLLLVSFCNSLLVLFLSAYWQVLFSLWLSLPWHSCLFHKSTSLSLLFLLLLLLLLLLWNDEKPCPLIS